MLASMTYLSCITFADDKKFFPEAQTLVFKHLHKALKVLIIIDPAVTDTDEI